MKLQDITLQQLIKKSGVKQKELALLLNLHESTVSLQISGKRKMSLEVAGIIADRLSTSLDQIRHALNFAKYKVISIRISE